MSPGWMLQALLAGALLGLGALAAERAAGWLGVPRRPLWAAAMLGSLLLPALSLWVPGLLPDLGIFSVAASPLPALDVGTLPLAADGPTPPVPGTAADGPAWWTDPAVLLGVGWLAASLAVLGCVAWTYLRLRTDRARAVPVEVDGGVVRVSERVGPAVVGLVHPTVVVPRWVLDAPAEERRLVLLHEREHVAAGDAWLLFLGTLALAAVPWSVPLWWQHRRLRAAVETDCDARVLARGADRRAYGRVLIRASGSTPGLPLLGPAWGDTPSQLERRIMAMTAKRPSHPLLRSLPLLALAAGVAAAACDAAGKGGAAPPALATAPTAGTADRAGGVAGPGSDEPVLRTDTAAMASITTDTTMVRVPSRSAKVPPSSTGFQHAFPVRLVETGPPVERMRVADYHRLASVRPGSNAERAGLRPGDVILALNGADARELRPWIALLEHEPGTRYVLRVRRGSAERDVVARLDPFVEGEQRF